MFRVVDGGVLNSKSVDDAFCFLALFILLLLVLLFVALVPSRI